MLSIVVVRWALLLSAISIGTVSSLNRSVLIRVSNIGLRLVAAEYLTERGRSSVLNRAFWLVAAKYLTKG